MMAGRGSKGEGAYSKREERVGERDEEVGMK